MQTTILTAKIKAIIFDMDGVLIDAKEWHYDALNTALALFGYSIERSEHISTYDGLPTSKKLKLLSTEKGLPTALHSFLNQLKQLYTKELIYTKCKPLFCHEYALAKLKENGFKLALASNSIRETIELMLTKANIIDYFDEIFSNQDVSKPKPDPEIYIKAISSLDLKPEQCLVVEDNPHGIKAAQEAGAHLMVVETVHDVNYENILRHIQRYTEEK